MSWRDSIDQIYTEIMPSSPNFRHQGSIEPINFNTAKLRQVREALAANWDTCPMNETRPRNFEINKEFKSQRRKEDSDVHTGFWFQFFQKEVNQIKLNNGQ